jgi:hypothetical protein
MKTKALALILTGFIAAYFSALSFAQDEQSSQQPAVSKESPAVVPETSAPPAAAPAAEAPAPVKPVQTEWLYGEVNSVDIAGNAIVLTYLDYDTDIEKQATVYADNKTIFENVKTLDEIKPQDMVSIDYVAGADSKNLAVTISVEKPENAEDLNAQPQVEEPAIPAMKPAVEAPAAPAPGNPSSPDSGSDLQPDKTQ